MDVPPDAIEIVQQCQAVEERVMDLDIVREARAADIPIALVSAIVLVESAGNPWQIRAEPDYRYLWHVGRQEPYRARTSRAPSDWVGSNVHSGDTEWIGQRISWGPMQVMGSTARELGFRGPLPRLCSPATGIHYGVQYLARLRDRYLDDGGWEAVAAAYNAGSPRRQDGQWVNQEYVDRVRAAGGFQGQ